jgi:hypothetical protein
MARLPDSLTLLRVSGACVAHAALTKTTARSRGISDRLMHDSFGAAKLTHDPRVSFVRIRCCRYRITPSFPGPRRGSSAAMLV